MKHLLLVMFLVTTFTVAACSWGENSAHTPSPNDIGRAEAKETVAICSASIKSIKEDIKIEKGCLELYKLELAKAKTANDDLYAREVILCISSSELYLKMLNTWLDSNKGALRYYELSITYYDRSDVLADLMIAEKKSQTRAFKELHSIDDKLDDIEDVLLDLDLANIKLGEEGYALCQSQLVEYREMQAIAISSENSFLTNWFRSKVEWLEDELVVTELYLDILRADLTERNNANRIAKDLREYLDHMLEPMSEVEWDRYNKKYDIKLAAQNIYLKRINAGYYEHYTVSTAYENRMLDVLDSRDAMLKAELARLMLANDTGSAESIRRVEFRINDNNTMIVHFRKYKQQTKVELKRNAKKLSKSEIKKIKAKYKDLFKS